MVDVENPVFHASDGSQSDFLSLTSEKIALTSEKWALTSEKHELHKILGTTLKQLSLQIASEVTYASPGLEIRDNTFYLEEQTVILSTLLKLACS